MTGLFLKLINMSITASWLIAVVVLIRLLLMKAPRWIPCIMWAMVAVRLICPFTFESAVSLVPETKAVPEQIIEMAQISPEETVSKPDFTGDTQSNAGNVGNIVLNNANYAVNTPATDEYIAPYIEQAPVTEEKSGLFTALNIAAGVWCFGAGAMLLYSMISFFRLRKRVRGSIKRQDNVWVCDDINSPFILGVINPRVYLPSGLSEKQTDYIIAHENAHLKRHDNLWKPIGFLLLSVYWFNPLVWLAYILLCRDIELACDEKAIKHMENTQRAEYSQTLLDCSVSRRIIAACPLAFGEVGVKKRVKTVLSYKKPAFWIIVSAIIVSAAVAMCFLTNPKSVGKSGRAVQIIGTGYDEDDVFADMPVRFDENGDLVVEATWKNKSGKVIMFSEQFELYMKKGDTFSKMAPYSYNGFGDFYYDHVTEKNRNADYKYNISAHFDISKNAVYRLKVKCRYFDLDMPFYSWLDFFIEKSNDGESTVSLNNKAARPRTELNRKLCKNDLVVYSEIREAKSNAAHRQIYIHNGVIYHTNGESIYSDWTKVGALESFDLSKENFDALFVNDNLPYRHDGYSVRFIRENTDFAEKAENELFKEFVYVLHLKNGETLVCEGSYGNGTEISDKAEENIGINRKHIQYVYRTSPLNTDMKRYNLESTVYSGYASFLSSPDTAGSYVISSDGRLYWNLYYDIDDLFTEIGELENFTLTEHNFTELFTGKFIANWSNGYNADRILGNTVKAQKTEVKNPYEKRIFYLLWLKDGSVLICYLQDDENGELFIREVQQIFSTEVERAWYENIPEDLPYSCVYGFSTVYLGSGKDRTDVDMELVKDTENYYDGILNYNGKWINNTGKTIKVNKRYKVLRKINGLYSEVAPIKDKNSKDDYIEIKSGSTSTYDYSFCNDYQFYEGSYRFILSYRIEGDANEYSIWWDWIIVAGNSTYEISRYPFPDEELNDKNSYANNLLYNDDKIVVPKNSFDVVQYYTLNGVFYANRSIDPNVKDLTRLGVCETIDIDKENFDELFLRDDSCWNDGYTAEILRSGVIDAEKVESEFSDEFFYFLYLKGGKVAVCSGVYFGGKANTGYYYSKGQNPYIRKVEILSYGGYSMGLHEVKEIIYSSKTVKDESGTSAFTSHRYMITTDTLWWDYEFDKKSFSREELGQIKSINLTKYEFKNLFPPNYKGEMDYIYDKAVRIQAVEEGKHLDNRRKFYLLYQQNGEVALCHAFLNGSRYYIGEVQLLVEYGEKDAYPDDMLYGNKYEEESFAFSTDELTQYLSNLISTRIAICDSTLYWNISANASVFGSRGSNTWKKIGELKELEFEKINFYGMFDDYSGKWYEDYSQKKIKDHTIFAQTVDFNWLEDDRRIFLLYQDNGDIAVCHLFNINASPTVRWIQIVKPLFWPVTGQGNNISYDCRMAYAGKSSSNDVFDGALNEHNKSMSDSVHLPVFKFDSVKDIEEFKNRYKNTFEFSKSNGNLKSFNEAMKDYDDEFFALKTVIAVYVGSESKSAKYKIKQFEINGKSLCIRVDRINAKNNDNDSVGYWLLVELDKAYAAKYDEFDAALGNLMALRERYPQYFGLDTTYGLEIYVSKMASSSYIFCLVQGTKEQKSWLDLIGLPALTAEDLKSILLTYNVSDEDISIFTYQNPISSYAWIDIYDRNENYLRNMLGLKPRNTNYH